MKTHILMLNERDTCAKLMSRLTKADQILLLFSPSDDMVSVKDFQLYANAKCKVQFIEAPETPESPDIGIAFALGKLIGQYPGASISGESKLFKILTAEQPAAPKRKRTVPPKTAKEDEFPMPKPIEPTEPEPEVKKARKPRAKKAPSANAFDEAYESLRSALTALGANKFNPADHIGSVCKAISLMDNEKCSFSDAIETCASNATAAKIKTAIADKLETIAALARNVNKLDKE